MPSLVHFVGTEKPVTLEDDYKAVTDKLAEGEAGEFKRSPSRIRLTIYKSSVTYIEERSAATPPAEFA